MQWSLALGKEIILPTLISILCSWLVSRYFFRKSSRAEIVAEQIKHYLQQNLIPNNHPDFFNDRRSIIVYPDQIPPANVDIPHVEFMRLDCASVRPGQTIGFLLKIKDTGFDLDNPKGIHVRDPYGRLVEIQAVGVGYCRGSISLSNDLAPGAYKVTVDLIDEGWHRFKANRNSQTLPIVVVTGEQS